MALTHYIDNALRANYIMLLDIDYVVSEEQEILIVDQFTGRTMEGRRFRMVSTKLLKQKRGYQFRMSLKPVLPLPIKICFACIKKLAGMTGTAKTEEEEFREIYNMRIIPIPTNRPVARIDHQDLLYPTLEAKFRAVVADVKERHERDSLFWLVLLLSKHQI